MLWICCGYLVHAQQIDTSGFTSNAVFLEVGGNGGMFSLNYERIFSMSDKTYVAPRLGVSEWSNDEEPNRYILVTGVSILTNGPKHFVEFGLGCTFYFESNLETWYPLLIGYRYHGPKGFLFRFSPMFITSSNTESFGNTVWLGASFGYTF